MIRTFVYIAVYLAISSIVIASTRAFAAPCYPHDNPYQLTLECQLNEGLPEAIQDFWRRFPEVAYFDGAEGLRIAYRVFLQPSASKAILIASGRTETLDKYQELIYDLYRQGYSVFIYDHRGHGYSQRVLSGEENHLHGHLEDFSNLVDDFTLFVEQVLLPSNHQQYYLLTHSMGGSVAMHYLAEHSDKVFNAAAHSAPMARANMKVPLACAISNVVSWFCATCLTPKEEYSSLEDEVALGGLSHSMPRYKLRNQAYSKPELRLGPPTFGWLKEACKSAKRIELSAHSTKTPTLILQAGNDGLVLPQAQNTVFLETYGAALPLHHL